MTRFSLTKFLLGLIALCLLPCLFMGRAGAQTTLPASRAYKPLSTTALYAEYLPSGLLSMGVNAGSAVSVAIPDASGNGHSMIAQATAAYQPTLAAPTHTRGPLSVYTLHFAPGNYVDTGFAMTGEYTILYVTRNNTTYIADNGKHSYLQAVSPPPAYNQWNSGVNSSLYDTRPASNHNYDIYGTYDGSSGIPTAGDLSVTAIMHSAAGFIKVNYAARGTVANTVPAYPDMGNLAIGDYGNSNLQGGADQNMVVMLLYSRQLSDTEIRAETYNIGINLMHNQSYYLFGNSLFLGYTATAGLDAITLSNQELGDPDIHFKNMSIVGKQTISMLIPVTMNSYTKNYEPIWGKQTAIFKELTNDVYNGNATNAQAIANAQQFVGNCLAFGFDSVAISTMQPRGSEILNTTLSTNRLAINAAMAAFVKTDPRLFLMDDGSDPRWGISGQQAVTTWYYTDSTHFNNAGYIAFAHDYIVPTLRNMNIGGSVPAGTKRRIQ